MDKYKLVLKGHFMDFMLRIEEMITLCNFYFMLMPEKFGAAMALVKSDIGGNITVSHISFFLPLNSVLVYIITSV